MHIKVTFLTVDQWPPGSVMVWGQIPWHHSWQMVWVKKKIKSTNPLCFLMTMNSTIGFKLCSNLQKERHWLDVMWQGLPSWMKFEGRKYITLSLELFFIITIKVLLSSEVPSCRVKITKQVSHEQKVRSAHTCCCCLTKYIRTKLYLRDINFVNALCRHMRKSF